MRVVTFHFYFSDAGSEDEMAVEEVKPTAAAKSKKDRKKKKEQELEEAENEMEVMTCNYCFRHNLSQINKIKLG